MLFIERLEKIAASGKVGHAYIFFGSDDEILEKAGQRFADLLEVKNEDLLRINFGGEEIKIEEIRELRRRLWLSPLFSPFKIAIISRAEKMNSESSNALLKILEEPRGKTVIVLLTSLPQSLLPTILSRCQLLNFYSALASKGEVYPQELEMDLATRFEYLEELSKKERQEIVNVLNNWLIIFRQRFLSDHSNIKIRKFLRKLMKTIFNLQTTNINSRLALEVLILDM